MLMGSRLLGLPACPGACPGIALQCCQLRVILAWQMVAHFEVLSSFTPRLEAGMSCVPESQLAVLGCKLPYADSVFHSREGMSPAVAISGSFVLFACGLAPF